MNIVDLISSQLSGDVLGKLGGLIGADEPQTRTATSAAVPALLNIFGKMASTNAGADQLAKAMGGLDLGMLGNLAGLLGGSQASSLGSLGGNLLGSLLGGSSTTSTVVDTIASFAGIKPGIMRTLLGYLAPIVLGMVAKQFTGRPDAAGVSRLFSEQSSNIRGAMPRGLTLPDLKLGAVSGGRAPEPVGTGGMPGWLLPLLLLAGAGLGWYIWQEGQKKKAAELADIAARETAQNAAIAVRKEVTRGPITVDRTEVIEREGKKLVDAVVETISIDPKFLEAGKVAGTLFTGLTKVLGGVTDEAGARAALPELERLAPMLTTLEDEAGKLPADEQPAFAEVISTNVGLLQRVIDTVMAIPGVKDLLGPVVSPMLETLTRLGTKR